MKIVPVVLAGGVGERFWPLSRQSRPKQLLPIVSRRTMIEETLARTRPFCTRGVRPVIVTGASIASRMRWALPPRLKYDCIVEPVGRNTAPAVAAAAVWLQKKYGDAIMLVLSADHAIRPAREFVKAARFAADLACAYDCLCVFGITPSRPETGYGYIHLGEQTSSRGQQRSYNVRRFVEKPSAALAKSYVSSGKYLWNSGMFVWKASVIMEEFAEHMPQLFQLARQLGARKPTARSLDTFYHACTRESIDYGIMEKSRRVTAVSPTFAWDDVGSWESIVRIHGCDGAQNTLVGGRVFTGECSESIVVNESGLSVAACGLKGMVVVAAEDAILVIARDKLPSMRQYLAAMKSGRSLPRNIF